MKELERNEMDSENSDLELGDGRGREATGYLYRSVKGFRLGEEWEAGDVKKQRCKRGKVRRREIRLKL